MPRDSVERCTGPGGEVIEGEATRVSPWQVEVDGRQLGARSLVIATGARPRVSDIPGLNDLDDLTSDPVRSLRALPQGLLVLGAVSRYRTPACRSSSSSSASS